MKVLILSRSLQNYLDFAVDLAKEAASISNKYFGHDNYTTEWKDDNTPLTIADTAINDMVIERVKKLFPEHGVIGEEASFNEDKQYVWVVDPIDGTMVFSTGMPLFTFCLALVRDGEVLVSVVNEPALGKLFTAIRGEGALLNGKPVKVSNKSDLKNAYIAANDGLGPGHSKVGAALLDIKNEGAIIFGVYSFAYMSMLVAEGYYVASIMNYGSPWDAAAASLIVEESGGKATDIDGSPRKYNQWGEGILISNGTELHEKLVKMVYHENPRD